MTAQEHCPGGPITLNGRPLSRTLRGSPAPFPRTSCARWQFCADFAVISAQECHFAPEPDDAGARRRRAGSAALVRPRWALRWEPVTRMGGDCRR